VSAAAAADWPQYRGPGRDGRSAETGLVSSWPTAGPRVVWRAALGNGYSGIAVAEGRVFTQFGNGRDEYAIAFDAATGKELWRARTDADRHDGQGSGPRSTPTVEGGTVYALSALGKLHAFAAGSGARRWTSDLVQEYGARVPQWGVSTSPLVEGDLLLVDAGGRAGHSLLALDKKTGKLAWASQTDQAGYSAPLAVTVDGQKQVLFFTGTSLVSVSPRDGKALWRVPWETSYDVNAAMPVFVPPDRVFISSGYDKGAQVLRVKRQGAGAAVEPVWRSRVMKNHFNSSVLVDGSLYGFDDGTLKSIDAASGEERWRARGFSKGSLLFADGHLWVLSERGLLALVEATPEAYREKARVQLFEARTWTMPSLADGRLFVRSEEELVALAVKR
jgi:outer membrane protein assembly factor BamB